MFFPFEHRGDDFVVPARALIVAAGADVWVIWTLQQVQQTPYRRWGVAVDGPMRDMPP
ncbi:hypothetical protein [Mycolicibacterium moriokaense]|uniref:Uncharacterized protein n=1 Tax=Mycolicibacterium moriokaense TaxID=39691 RepID=A0AAD1H603_9MYCO|nr:hypothetical protein [Mycolicibacterium moriokaense]MCV7042498.1 hypothetical protein [Mycolicibacterium moriokaense]BBW99171.1 hypothetical protein MMOR_01080 [Mycolicibacterium moriokaense]